MAKIVLGVAIVLMLATAFFGFQTKTTITGLRDNLKTTTEHLQTTQKTLAKTQDDLKASQAETASEKQRADAATADAAAAKADAQAKADQIKDVQAKLDAANAQVADLTGKMGNATPGAGGSGDEVARLNDELKKAQTQIAELEQVKTTLENKSKAAESEATDLRQKEQRRQSGLMRPGLEGQVLAVNPGWNFIVLSLGDRQGAVMNAEMLVVRGNERIAKVRITSVEPSTSVADIVPGTTAHGARVQPGDRVIFPGS